MMRPFWILLGWLALALGAVGVVLPVLPTTPFVILAAFAFARGSPAIAQRLEAHRVFGPIIADWRARGAIATRYKIAAVAMMTAALALSLAMGFAGHVIAIQAVCMAGAAAYVLSRPSA
ncbi:MAG: YbaN family protein [Pseudomonadota bacterium]